MSSDAPPIPNQPPLSDDELAQHLAILIAGSPTVMAVLTGIRALNLPDWRMFSGAVYQTVWNALTERDANHGVKDYDIGYFDPDTSWDAEDVVIKRAASVFNAALAAKVEVRNQARVHLWFEGKFGEPYSPLVHTAQALDRFTSATFSVGVRLEADDRLTVIAPFGLEDLFALRLRPNPERKTDGFARTAASARARWPELIVIN